MIHKSKIKDKFGKEYRIEWEEDGGFGLQSVFLFDGELQFGYVHCYFVGEKAMIQDIELRDDLFCPQTKLRSFIYRLLKIQRVKLNYRNSGMGTALLEFLFSYFSKRKVKRIEGKISVRDLKQSPFLPAWYRKLGFYVPESGVGEIWKEL